MSYPIYLSIPNNLYNFICVYNLLFILHQLLGNSLKYTNLDVNFWYKLDTNYVVKYKQPDTVKSDTTSLNMILKLPLSLTVISGISFNIASSNKKRVGSPFVA